MSPEGFSGQGFIVTGGTRGLGRAIVLAAAERGAHVVFCARPGAEEMAAKVIADSGAAGRVLFVAANASIAEEVDRLFDAAMDFLPALTVVVNNAAIVLNKLLIETSLEEWNEVAAVNLRGPFLVSQRAVEEFILGGDGGRIINVSSIAANGSTGQAAYAASKSGLIALTRSVAKEYGKRGILCNAVVPGYLESDMTNSFSAEGRAVREQLSPMRRFGRLAEVVEAVFFLASGEASFVNGDALYVSGTVRDVPDLRS